MADFTWGDTVRVKVGAAHARRPEALAEIVGVREVETDEQAREFASPIGSKLYLIEFADGISLEIPEFWLEAVSGIDDRLHTLK